MTYTEVRLWIMLKSKQLDGWKFRRQTPIGPHYIVDFYCHAARLVVELDGASHGFEDQYEYDLRRQSWLESHGYTVLRFSAENPEGDYLEGVWETIQLALEQAASMPPPALRATSPHGGEDI
jgi:very-short-patch-repair endonuclease